VTTTVLVIGGAPSLVHRGPVGCSRTVSEFGCWFEPNRPPKHEKSRRSWVTCTPDQHMTGLSLSLPEQ
jgi:hypothetical protein